MQQPFKFAAAAAAVFSTINAYASDQATLQPEIIVTATRDQTTSVNPAQDATVVDRTAIEQSGSASLAEVLANQAAVEITTNGGPLSTTGILVRGTKPAQSAVLLDGFHLVNPTDGTSPINALPLSMMERVEVLRGGASGSYGSGAIGGVVQLFTRNPDHAPALDAGATYGRYGTFSTDVGYGGKLGADTFYVSAGLDGSEGFSATNSASPDFNPDKDGYGRKNFAATFAHDFGDGQQVRLITLYTDSHAAYDSAFAPAPSFDNQIQLIGATYGKELNDIWHTEVKLGETDYDYQYKNAGFAFSPNTSDLQLGWTNYLTLPIGKLILGAEREQQTIGGTGVSTSYQKTRRNINTLLAQWQGTYGANQIQAAVRHDQWTDYNGQTTGNVLYAYNLTKQWSLTGALAKAFRAPTFDDLYFPFGSNPNLLPEKSRSTELGTRYRSGADELRFVAFRNRIGNSIELDALFIPQNVQALIKGWTVSWDHARDDWRWAGTFTHQDPKDLDTGDQLDRRARTIVTASVERLVNAWRVGGEFRSQDERFSSSPNSPATSMAGYGLLNAYVGYAVSPHVTLQARLDNLTDKKYELVRGYNTPGRALSLTVRYSGS